MIVKSYRLAILSLVILESTLTQTSICLRNCPFAFDRESGKIETLKEILPPLLVEYIAIAIQARDTSVVNYIAKYTDILNVRICGFENDIILHCSVIFRFEESTVNAIVEDYSNIVGKFQIYGAEPVSATNFINSLQDQKESCYGNAAGH